ncbi:ornithine cyclodeaminase [Zavarzinella formosa]|uniref:ornithine cyclodeaminase n=1 Tax=Zavarzinella formosa TaxID=360055 RepID=UPI0002DB9158|nr:TIGR00300 family protein [Zavarzinella formosa]
MPPHPLPAPVPLPDATVIEEIEVRGHIIDSLILPKILDRILQMGGSFEIRECVIGSQRKDPSHARVAVRAKSPEGLDAILADLVEHGATTVNVSDAQVVVADMAAAFPDKFYSTTNQATQVRIGGRWIDVADQEMDCGIVIDLSSKTARCVAMLDVTPGMSVVVGHAGVRVIPAERPPGETVFGFMNSAVSSEKPKAVSLRAVAESIREARKAGQKVLLVGGPAIIHTGSGPHVAKLIEQGWVQTLFAGNALATHDLEQAIYGTSLGVDLGHGQSADHGHEHHLRTINSIRRLGGIKNAIDSGLVKSGIMYEAYRKQIDIVLAGSIRDDGPLPEVITDVIEAQRRMRESVKGVGFALMIATMLHSVATGNLLPARVKVVCVDINPSALIKLSDRGSSQTISLVTDVEPFLRSLAAELAELTVAPE